MFNRTFLKGEKMSFDIIWKCTEGLHGFLWNELVRNCVLMAVDVMPDMSAIMQETLETAASDCAMILSTYPPAKRVKQSTGANSHSPACTCKLTRTRGRWMPRLSVSPARCTGSFGGAGNARFSGRSARCRWAVCRAGWAGLPASPGDSRSRQHLLR